MLLDIHEEDKETALSIHGEKLAIAFGLMNTGQDKVSSLQRWNLFLQGLLVEIL